MLARGITLRNCLFQSALATVTLLGILFYFGLLTRTAIVAALGASTFIVFGIPNSKSAEPRRVIGGHGVCLGVASIFTLLLRYYAIQEITWGRGIIYISMVAIAVGTAMFVMAITGTQHPPAAGSAFGLVASGWETGTVAFVIGTAFVLSVTRHVLRRRLVDLI